jgi:hypothetical protein
MDPSEQATTASSHFMFNQQICIKSPAVSILRIRNALLFSKLIATLDYFRTQTSALST